MKVVWFSAGISSFIACYLTKDVDKIIYIDIDDQHPDSIRFVKDCEIILGKPIEILKSHYGCVENAIRAATVIKLPSGFAPCTNWLKKRVRMDWEYEHQGEELTYVWGFDCEERARAERLIEAMPKFKNEFPLIENNLTKQDCHAIANRLGLKRPAMYDFGYNNNNCIGCIKGGMGYWNKIRKDFPEVFKRRAKLEREIGHSILKECYLDELEPNKGAEQKEILEECGIFCELALKNKELEKNND